MRDFEDRPGFVHLRLGGGRPSRGKSIAIALVVIAVAAALLAVGVMLLAMLTAVAVIAGAGWLLYRKLRRALGRGGADRSPDRLDPAMQIEPLDRPRVDPARRLRDRER